jgi:flavin-dependent dehydrogenase
VANLGLGCLPSARPLARLEELRQELLAQGVIGPGCLARSGGAIPVGGPRPQPWEGRVLLAGDAAGLTHPLTGAGIPQAVFSGAQAGQAALALAGGAAEAAQEYAHALSLRYGRYLQRGLAARRQWEEGWQGDFAGLMARTWPGWRASNE